MDLLNKLPDELHFNVIKYLKHPIAEIIDNIDDEVHYYFYSKGNYPGDIHDVFDAARYIYRQTWVMRYPYHYLKIREVPHYNPIYNEIERYEDRFTVRYLEKGKACPECLSRDYMTAKSCEVCWNTCFEESLSFSEYYFQRFSRYRQIHLLRIKENFNKYIE